MIAAHFGAGNIGRGFIGCLLNQAGYELVFLDVNAEVVDLLNQQSSYKVIETGVGAKTHTVSNYQAFNSQTQFDEAAQVLASADLVTASVGPNVLKFLAPLIVAGLNARSSSTPLVIMACENAIGATDLLKAEIEKLDAAAAKKAVYANTAVDRIVPPQKPGLGLDVLVEAFSEWVIDSSELAGQVPNIPGAIFVEDLVPFIERKLFTVNTGHATLAYCGQQAGAETIVEASANPQVLAVVAGALAETSEVLITRHGFNPADHAKYVAKTIDRFSNPDLDDPVIRVGRQPARKLSRNDRLIAPAAYLAESGKNPKHLLQAVEAALLFKDGSDPEVAALHEKLLSLSAPDFASQVMGITAQDALAEKLISVIQKVKSKDLL